MEHEVFVPVPGERLRAVLADPARVARAVPGLQQDAGGAPLAGRLKLRIGGHSITYRGALRITARDDGSHHVEGDAGEARGSGTVKLALTVRLRDAEGGTLVSFGGTATAGGRVTELPVEEVAGAVARLLNRFVERLGQEAAARQPGHAGAGEAESPELLSAGEFEAAATSDFETTPDADDAPAPGPGGEAGDAGQASRSPAGEDHPEAAEAPDAAEGPATGDAGDGTPLSDAEVPPSPDPAADDGRAVAEAAHARRTMIGRSAEEVDHAPPRGRYAPVPAPQPVSPVSALRWAVPAAVAAVASAVVVGRVLRKRR
ncbi:MULTISPECIES: SRPBCC domain-containing protein [unclassified Streptomyces]|uniref:SRPBCC domain-containing protein n=1 Tax=unclassified Streptomyces TaxID=2593676 RepID=UPI001F0470B5|nr:MULTISPECIES: SRPBCC domain-containing protein [unclassified Streptomyces]MCH0562906.1 SRPBCC family protein [Streptomyces sp. MUM 2J]MCH0571689.1 SRPBCC family protein [Streptomyces sp. MUM 136J]